MPGPTSDNDELPSGTCVIRCRKCGCRRQVETKSEFDSHCPTCGEAPEPPVSWGERGMQCLGGLGLLAIPFSLAFVVREALQSMGFGLRIVSLISELVAVLLVMMLYIASTAVPWIGVLADGDEVSSEPISSDATAAHDPRPGSR